MAKEKFNISTLVSSDGCFDLQFRKDTRKERTNSPTYYRWKTQFVVTLPKKDIKILNKVKSLLCCGQVCVSKDQARYSVQKISDVAESIVPFFRKNQLIGNKKKDFELWAKAVDIIQNNKGKPLAGWKKSDVCNLIEIHKSSAKYKIRARAPKWLDMAKSLSKSC